MPQVAEGELSQTGRLAGFEVAAAGALSCRSKKAMLAIGGRIRRSRRRRASIGTARWTDGVRARTEENEDLDVESGRGELEDLGDDGSAC
jgi:hypothetical protein